MSVAAELRLNRRNTLRFIEANPIVLALTPAGKERTPTGGYKSTPQPPREPQTMRLIDLSNDHYIVQLPQRTVSGEETSIQYILLGAYDAIMQEDDYWENDLGRWVVAQVWPHNGYEMRATVTRYGRN